MKILFTSDLHGRKGLYGQMLDLARRSSARCVVIGGDLLPTRLVLSRRTLTDGIDFNQSLDAQMAFIDSFLAPMLNGFVREHPGVSILYVPGNHDWETALARLALSAPGAVCLHGRKQVVGDLTFTGYGCVIDSSFWVKDYVRRDTTESSFIRSRYPLVSTPDGVAMSWNGAYALNRPSIEEELSVLSLDEPERTICIFHSPPHGTGLDTLHNGKPIGSRAITGFIAENRPMMSLHGHIHEAPYMTGSYHTMIGPTLAVNPGHDPLRLHAVIFDSLDPIHTLTHSVFGRMPATRSRLDMVRDRCTRIIKGIFMKKVLMR